MSKSRIIELAAGQRRDPGENRRTEVMHAVPTPRHASDFRRAFLDHYHRFAPGCRAFDQPGLAVVAIDLQRDRLAGVACIPARVASPNVLVAGRHSQADLLIDSAGELSLRHLAILLEPVTRLDRPGDGVAYRVVDLRSQAGIQLEGGRTVGGLRADGPAFFAAANHAFFAFVTGDPTDWPECPRAAWSFIPERIYLAEQPRFADGSGEHGRAPAAAEVPIVLPVPDADERRRQGITQVRRTSQPWSLNAGSLLAPDEAPVAELHLATPEVRTRIAVGRTALDAGILLGRYDRCDAASAFTDESLSRVHLLILDLAGTTHAFDTASTYGSRAAYAPDARFRTHPLRADTRIELAGYLELAWRWLAS